MKKKPKSILVVTLSNIGDVVITTPAIMTLASQFPEARITIVVGPRAKAILEKSARLHRVVVYNKKADLLGKWRFLMELYKDRYDWIVDLKNTAIPFLVPCKKRGPLFRKPTKVRMRERHLEVLERMGLEVQSPPLFQFFDEKDEASCISKLKGKGITDSSGWILVAPGAATERKRWSVDSFREIAQELSRKTGKRIFLIGSKEERPIAEELNKGIQSSYPVFCGEMSLSETACLISKAALVVANDSAIMHLGFEIRTPTVGIFGPTDPERCGPDGRYFRIACGDAAKCACNSESLLPAFRDCFHGLTPTKVVELCLEILK